MIGVEGRPLGVVVVGAGTVGGGLIRELQATGESNGLLLRHAIIDDPNKLREFSAPYSTDWGEALRDPKVDLVVHLVPGVNPALGHAYDSIERELPFITANKALIAASAKELFDAARNRIEVRYDAAVGGEIDAFDAIRGSEQLTRVLGIINGTTNYILTRMGEGMDFESALAEAQRLGFAEKDHILDTGGFDTRDKLIILAAEAFNARVLQSQIQPTGITDITPEHIDLAKQNGQLIKLIASAERDGGILKVGVSPTLVNDDDLIAVSKVLNAIKLIGPGVERTLVGRGAGRDATTIAVMRDILRAADNRRRGIVNPTLTLDAPFEIVDFSRIPTRDGRLNIEDFPVLAA